MTSNQVAYAGVQVSRSKVELDREVAAENARHNVQLESLSKESNRIAEEYNVQRNAIEKQKADVDQWYKQESIRLSGEQNELMKLRDQYAYEVNKIKAEADALNAQTNVKHAEIEAFKADELKRHDIEMEAYNTKLAENQAYANETERKKAYYQRLASHESYEVGLTNAQAAKVKSDAYFAQVQHNITTGWEFEKKATLSSEIRNWYSAITHAKTEDTRNGIALAGLVGKIAETAVMAGGF